MRATARRRDDGPAGYGLHGRSKTLKSRRTVIFQTTSEWKTAVARNGKRVTTPQGVRLSEEEQGSEG